MIAFWIACASSGDINVVVEPESTPQPEATSQPEVSEPETAEPEETGEPTSEPSSEGGVWSFLSVGETHNCAIDPQQQAVCWGYDSSGQLDVPDDSFVEVDAGLWQSCGINTAGEVLCWGCQGNDLGQCDAPEGTFISLSTGPYHGCAIDESGTAQCWAVSYTHLTLPTICSV